MITTSSLHNIQSQTQSSGSICPDSVDLAGYSLETVRRFWSKVAIAGVGECWTWLGSVTGSGSVRHGQFTLGRRDGKVRNRKAHRLAWELTRGPIPDGLYVCHHCDVPRCCNPFHLFVGTQDDNMKDAARKDRFHRPHTKVFTPAERLAIEALPYRRGLIAELAKQYGVSKSAISYIRNGRFVGSPKAYRPARKRA